MIKFEHNMLVLSNAFSKEDVKQIDDFADYIRDEERERIIKLLEGKQLGCSCGCDKWLEPWSLIALIKGENNGPK